MNLLPELSGCKRQDIAWNCWYLSNKLESATNRNNTVLMLIVIRTSNTDKNTVHIIEWGTRWRSWLRHSATSRDVASAIPDGVIGIFHWHNPSGRTMTLGLTQPLKEMSTRNISWRVKASWCIGLTTLPPSWADCLEIWEPQPPGILRACPGL